MICDKVGHVLAQELHTGMTVFLYILAGISKTLILRKFLRFCCVCIVCARTSIFQTDIYCSRQVSNRVFTKNRVGQEERKHPGPFVHHVAARGNWEFAHDIGLMAQSIKYLFFKCRTEPTMKDFSYFLAPCNELLSILYRPLK